MKKHMAPVFGFILLAGLLAGCSSNHLAAMQESQSAETESREYSEQTSRETPETSQGAKLSAGNDQLLTTEETTQKSNFEVKDESVGDILSWDDFESMPNE